VASRPHWWQSKRDRGYRCQAGPPLDWKLEIKTVSCERTRKRKTSEEVKQLLPDISRPDFMEIPLHDAVVGLTAELWYSLGSSGSDRKGRELICI
jgi:hypothetical protein